MPVDFGKGFDHINKRSLAEERLGTLSQDICKVSTSKKNNRLHHEGHEGHEGHEEKRPYFLAFHFLKEEKGYLQHRLLREIARQAVLNVAREELGLPTRDQTLGEPFPNMSEHQPAPLELELRIRHGGKYSLRLMAPLIESPDSAAEKKGETEEIEKRASESEKPPVAEDQANRPAWTDVISPYCRFEQDALQKVAKNHPKLEALVQLLRWQHFRSYQHGRWIYEKGIEAMAHCPEAYSIYSVMANWNALRIQRTGALSGMQAFSQKLPLQVAALTNAPEIVTPVRTGGSWWSQLFGTRGTESEIYSQQPICISQALIRFSKENLSPADLSWAVLGSLVEECSVSYGNISQVPTRLMDGSFHGGRFGITI